MEQTVAKNPKVMSRVQWLQRKRQQLSKQIKELEKDPAFCSLSIAKLKKQKLHYRDQIEAEQQALSSN